MSWRARIGLLVVGVVIYYLIKRWANRWEEEVRGNLTARLDELDQAARERFLR